MRQETLHGRDTLTEDPVEFRRTRQRRQRGIVRFLGFTAKNAPFQRLLAGDDAVEFRKYRL